MSGVYAIKNKLNNKLYIGSTKNKFNIRFNKHINDLSKNKHVNKSLQSDWNKYSKEAFEFVVLEECPPHAVKLAEQITIDKFNPKLLYNYLLNTDYLLAMEELESKRLQSNKSINNNIITCYLNIYKDRESKLFSAQLKLFDLNKNINLKELTILDELKNIIIKYKVINSYTIVEVTNLMKLYQSKLSNSVDLSELVEFLFKYQSNFIFLHIIS